MARGMRITMAALAAGVVITGGAAAPAWAVDPPDIDEWSATVTGDSAMGRVADLQTIAEENGGTRAAGEPGYLAALDYAERELKAAGYQTERQAFDFTYAKVISAGLAETSPDRVRYEFETFLGGPNTPDGEAVTAPLAVPNSTPDPNPDDQAKGSSGIQGCEASDWQGAAAIVEGRIGLVERGTCPFRQKAQVAAEAGAVGLIVYNNEPGGAPAGTLGEQDDSELAPSLAISQDDGRALADKVARRTASDEVVTVDFQVNQFIEQRTTWNLLAETPEGRDDNVVLAGAHLDGSQVGVGVNDNGAGAAALLETAVKLRDRPENIKNKVRFAFWSAEEIGLLGSNYYVADLVDNKPTELDDIALYLNFDMVASTNYIVGVYDGDESTYPAPEGVSVPQGSAPLEKLITDRFDAQDQPWVDTEFSGRSDYQAFIANDIPASGLFSGAEGIKTEQEAEAFGGTAGQPYDPNYHAPDDDIDNASLDALNIFAPAMAYAVYTVAYDSSPVNGKYSIGDTAEPGTTQPRGTPSADAARKPTSGEPSAGQSGSGSRPALADTGAADLILPGALGAAALLLGAAAVARVRHRSRE